MHLKYKTLPVQNSTFYCFWYQKMKLWEVLNNHYNHKNHHLDQRTFRPGLLDGLQVLEICATRPANCTNWSQIKFNISQISHKSTRTIEMAEMTSSYPLCIFAWAISIQILWGMQPPLYDCNWNVQLCNCVMSTCAFVQAPMSTCATVQAKHNANFHGH